MDTQKIIPVGRFKPKHFVIPDPEPNRRYMEGMIYQCKNTITEETITAEYTGEYFMYPWDKLPESFYLTNFDVTKDYLKKAFEQKFPEIRGIASMRFLIMKEI